MPPEGERRGGGREAIPAGAPRGRREPLFGGGGRVSGRREVCPLWRGLPAVAGPPGGAGPSRARRVSGAVTRPPCPGLPRSPPARTGCAPRTWKNQPGGGGLPQRRPRCQRRGRGCGAEGGGALRPLRLWTPRGGSRWRPGARYPRGASRAPIGHSRPSGRAVPGSAQHSAGLTAGPTLARRTPAGALLLRRLKQSKFLP